MAPHEMDILISSTFIFFLIAFMVFIVIKDLVIPSGMNKWAASIIGFVLLTAPMAFAIKNIYVITASFNL